MTGWIPRLLGYATVGAGAAAAGYVGLVTGACPLDLGLGRRVRPLGPQQVEMAAPRELVFDVIAEPYLGRTPRALAHLPGPRRRSRAPRHRPHRAPPARHHPGPPGGRGRRLPDRDLGGALEARGIPTGDGRLRTAAVGEVELDGQVLVIRRIHLTTGWWSTRRCRRPTAAGGDPAAAGVHADRCPVAWTIGGCVALSTSLDLRPVPAAS